MYSILRSCKTLLCTSGLALMLFSCENAPTAETKIPETDAPKTEAKAETMRTNIRLAKRNDRNEFVEGRKFVRDVAHIEQILPAIYQNEGPAWENENIGFRMYWDERNGIDIHGKKVRDLVLDTVGLDRNDYHKMSDWGMDVLKVKNSLGAGSIALMIDGKIHRIGDATEERVMITEETAVRSAFHLDYDGLAIAGRIIDLDWDISIEAGTHGYESSITATGLTGGEELLIGIVNQRADKVYTMEMDDRFAIYTHAPQAELDHYLGMAVSVDKEHYIANGELAPDAQPVSSSYYVRAKLEEGKPTGYRFTAGWAPGHPEFKQREAFAEVIR